MTIEAMKQALEALEKCKKALAEELSAWDIDPPLHHVLEAHDLCDPAITSLRQAIEQAEKQEPVAWIEHEWSGTGLRHLHFERREASLRDEVVNPIWTPLYTTPQPQREWVGLTDEEIEIVSGDYTESEGFKHGARWALDQLKEKNT